MNIFRSALSACVMVIKPEFQVICSGLHIFNVIYKNCTDFLPDRTPKHLRLYSSTQGSSHGRETPKADCNATTPTLTY